MAPRWHPTMMAKGWPGGTGTLELPRPGICTSPTGRGKKEGWGTGEVIAVILVRGGQGATKNEAPLAAAVSDRSQTAIDFSVLRPGEQALV